MTEGRKDDGGERGSILAEAHDIINGERQQQYGSPEDSHNVIAQLWNGYRNAKAAAGSSPEITPRDVAHMMVLFKLARELNGAGKRDNYRDAAGYLAIAADMQDSEPKPSLGNCDEENKGELVEYGVIHEVPSAQHPKIPENWQKGFGK